MEIVLADPTGSMQRPSKGATVSIWLGYESGNRLGDRVIDRLPSLPDGIAGRLQPGLTKMGDFVVDEVEIANPPRQITVRGNAIDLRATSKPKARKREHYEEETVESLVGKLASEMGYGSAVHPDLAGKEVPYFDRDAESPMSAVTRLARRFDAVATVKEGVLGFVPAGIGETASGSPIPPINLSESVCTRWRFGITDRSKYAAVEARYHDFFTAEDVWVKHGDDADGTSTYQLRQTYPDRTSAEEAARANDAKNPRRCCTETPFHGGNRGSNPRGDAHLAHLACDRRYHALSQGKPGDRVAQRAWREVRVPLRCRVAGVASEDLDRAQGHARLDQMRAVRVAQTVD